MSRAWREVNSKRPGRAASMHTSFGDVSGMIVEDRRIACALDSGVTSLRKSMNSRLRVGGP